MFLILPTPPIFLNEFLIFSRDTLYLNNSVASYVSLVKSIEHLLKQSSIVTSLSSVDSNDESSKYPPPTALGLNPIISVILLFAGKKHSPTVKSA